MKSAVETLNPTRVKLTVEVPFDELKPSLDAAYKTIGSQVQIPGFRRGKVPARIIDQRVGRGAVLEEAVNSALPTFYGQAVEEAKIRPLGQPEVEITEAPDPATGGDLKFSVEVDVRPEVTLPDYATLAVTVDDVVVDEADVESEITALRQRFGTLVGVERAAVEGDFVSMDLAAEIDGDEIDAVTGVSYEIGSRNMLDGLDDALVGMSAGETKNFTAPLAGGDREGQEADVTVTVQSVKERELPDLDDEFAQLASEFDTLDELNADLRSQAERAKSCSRACRRATRCWTRCSRPRTSRCRRPGRGRGAPAPRGREPPGGRRAPRRGRAGTPPRPCRPSSCSTRSSSRRRSPSASPSWSSTS